MVLLPQFLTVFVLFLSCRRVYELNFTIVVNKLRSRIVDVDRRITGGIENSFEWRGWKKNPRVYYSQVRPLRICGSGLCEKLLTRKSIDPELYILGYTRQFSIWIIIN